MLPYTGYSAFTSRYMSLTGDGRHDFAYLQTVCRAQGGLGARRGGAEGCSIWLRRMRRSIQRIAACSHRIVVFPALSSPSTSMRASFSPNMLSSRDIHSPILPDVSEEMGLGNPRQG